MTAVDGTPTATDVPRAAASVGSRGAHSRGPGHDAQDQPKDRRRPTASPTVAPPRTRRRPGMMAAGVALVALGALGAAYLTQVVAGTTPVVAVVRDVPAGEVIGRADLAVTDVSTDATLQPVGAGRLNSFVGQRAAVDLSAGTLLTEAAVAEQVLPATGQSLVGVALTAAQLPAEAVQRGDRVRVVSTPTAQGEPPSTTPEVIAGEVLSVVGPDDAGLTVVNLLVPENRAADLAARVATGRVALVLDSRQR